jgi:NADPH:quinone reductase
VPDAATYRAIVCTALGSINQLELRHLARAPLPPNSVRVTIKAAGVNFPDVLMVRGTYQHRPALPFVPGLEAAGLVSEVAGEPAAVAVGDRVIVQMRTGAYAEEAVVGAEQVRPLPPAFTFAEAATFLVAHLTAYHALKSRADLRAGQTLLVLGAAGGVGLAALQIGKVLGARVIAAASSADKLRAAQSMGADALIDYVSEPLAAAVQRRTAGAGADVVFDPVGVASPEALRCLAWNGKLLIVGFSGGSIPAQASNRILLKAATVMGIRAGEAGRQDPALRRQELDALQALARQGLIKPLVSAHFALQQCGEAMRLLAERRAIGRIALIPPP